MITSKVSISVNDLEKELMARSKQAQVALDTQVLKDSNFYAPQDTSELIRSGIRNTIPGTGQVMWNTPYARRLYYNPQYNFSKDKNPNASGLWFEHAKSMQLPVWLDIARSEMGGR